MVGRLGIRKRRGCSPVSSRRNIALLVRIPWVGIVAAGGAAFYTSWTRPTLLECKHASYIAVAVADVVHVTVGAWVAAIALIHFHSLSDRWSRSTVSRA